jgi:hypothetical protein
VPSTDRWGALVSKSRILAVIIAAVAGAAATWSIPVAAATDAEIVARYPRAKLDEFRSRKIVYSANDRLCGAFITGAEFSDTVVFPQWHPARNVFDPDGGQREFYSVIDIDNSGEKRVVLVSRREAGRVEQQALGILKMNEEQILASQWSTTDIYANYKYDAIDGPFADSVGGATVPNLLDHGRAKPIFPFMAMTSPFFWNGKTYIVASAEAYNRDRMVGDGRYIELTTVVFMYKYGAPEYICYLSDER